MDTDTDLSLKIPQINECLADINKTNRDIIDLLDILEDKQKRHKEWKLKQEEQQKQQTTKQAQQQVPKDIQTHQTCHEKASVSTETSIARPNALVHDSCTLDEDKDSLHDDSNKSQHSVTPNDGSTNGSSKEPIHLGVLNLPRNTTATDVNVGTNATTDAASKGGTLDKVKTTDKEQWKLMQGFTEQLKLTEKHVMYGNVLRRNKTDLCRDNRVCLKFGLHANPGRIYKTTTREKDEQQCKEPVCDTRSKQLQVAEKRRVQTNSKLSVGQTRSSDTKSENTRSGIRHKRIVKNKKTSEVKPRMSTHLLTQGTLSKQQDGHNAISRVEKKSEETVSPPAVKGEQAVATPVLSFSLDADNEADAKVLKGLEASLATMMSMFPNVADGSIGFEEVTAAIQNMGFGGNSVDLEQLVAELKRIVQEESMTDKERNKLKDLLKLMELVLNRDQTKISDEELCKVYLDMIRKNPDLLEMNKQWMQTLVTLVPQQTPAGKEKVTPAVTKPVTEPARTLAPPSRATAAALEPLPERLETVQTKGHARLEQEDRKEQQDERVYINEGLWSDYANEEVAKAKNARDIRETGMDTIFCLDLSESMKGAAWEQAVTFIREFIDGIQNITVSGDVYEHIALVTFGSETKVQQHLTCDYLEVTRKLDRLHPAGPSPLFAGLTMTWAAVLGAGTVFSCHGYKIHPRIYLLTDGKVTPASLIAGPDSCTTTETLIETDKIMNLTMRLHKDHKITILPVPVGEFDLSLLEKMVSVTNGKIVSPEEWRIQSRSFNNYMEASKMGSMIPSPEMISIYVGMAGKSAEDQVQMEEFLRTHSQDEELSGDSLENPDFPPLGSRVKRNTAIYDMAIQQVGTITKHMSDGHVGVTWDKAIIGRSKHEKIFYIPGHTEISGVLVTTDPRVLSDDELIDVGCRVKRGPDWLYGDQDGGDGNLGSVFEVNENGYVIVRWDHGVKAYYRFGSDGKFELTVVRSERIQMKEKKDAPSTEEAMNQRNIDEMNRRNAASASTMKGHSNDTSNSKTSRSRDFILDDEDDTRPRIIVPGERMLSAERIGGNTESRRLGGLSSTLERNQKASVDTNEDKTKSEKTETNCNTANQLSLTEKRNEKNMTSKGVHSDGADTSSGTRLKAYQINEKDRTSDNATDWLWKDGGTWKPFSRAIADKIEASYQKKPTGTVIIILDGQQYRIVFSRMERINITTKEKCQVTRTCT